MKSKETSNQLSSIKIASYHSTVTSLVSVHENTNSAE